ncbi:hypothetical protein BKA57DRAFT_452050 [Linnemannia elongata]|nr:hypothetical protein BKA57DRAFT_452050 [Linnemannia elongata]
MSFKPTFLILLAVAVLLVIVSSHQADAWAIWCICGDSRRTQNVCHVADGNWDGGSCGLPSPQKYSFFTSNCKNIGGTPQCWS